MNRFLETVWNLFQSCILFMFQSFGHEARGIPVLRPEIEPSPPALEGEVSAPGPPRKSLCANLLFSQGHQSYGITTPF